MHRRGVHPDPTALLAVYDEQLRTDSETPSATAVTRLGPLRLVTFPAGRGFVTYRDLGGADWAAISRLVPEALEHFRTDPEITRIEWKTRGHDHAPGLHAALLDSGFVPDEPESIMIGAAAALAVDVSLPEGVVLRTVTTEADVRAMCAMQDVAFGEPVDHAAADAVLRRLARDDGMELWVAEMDGRVISAGRLEPVAGTDVAGIWGGATRPEWRGRGGRVYRALTGARAGRRVTAPWPNGTWRDREDALDPQPRRLTGRRSRVSVRRWRPVKRRRASSGAGPGRRCGRTTRHAVTGLGSGRSRVTERTTRARPRPSGRWTRAAAHGIRGRRLRGSDTVSSRGGPARASRRVRWCGAARPRGRWPSACTASAPATRRPAPQR